MHILKSLNRNVGAIKTVILVGALFPAGNLWYQYATNQLGINGLETLLHTTGFTALLFYILTLSITPLRRISSYFMILARHPYGKRLGDWNWMIRIRRMLGVTCFLYACLHFVLFFYFELDFNIDELRNEIWDRPFILAGIAALALLLPLFLTSTNSSMRRLKKNWRRLHRLMYPIGLLIALHYFWLGKPGVYDAYPFLAIILLLLGYRIFDYYNLILRRKDDGMIAER